MRVFMIHITVISTTLNKGDYILYFVSVFIYIMIYQWIVLIALAVAVH